MSLKSRKHYLERVRSRYQKASRNQKKLILDELCENTGYHRKYAIRFLSSRPLRRPQLKRKPGRPSQYNLPELLQVKILLLPEAH